MPTRDEIVAEAVEIFDRASYPSGSPPGSAWLGVYQTVLWWEHVGDAQLPHIIDADKLRGSRVWQKRAHGVTAYLAQELHCPPGTLPERTDLLMKRPPHRGKQRQNILGIAFAGLAKHILQRFGSQRISYAAEVRADHIFPGTAVPGRSVTPSIDLVASRENAPRALVSAKWSLRHDRLNDITNECPVYKAAYERIYRRAASRPLLYFVVTNEYDPSRLSKLLEDPCVDGVVHVHKPAVVDVCGLDDRLGGLMDLTDLVAATDSW
jgi:hypothetical protein